MNKALCFGGKILRVNLTTGKWFSEPTTRYIATFAGKRGIFLGGKEINTWMLYREVKPWVAPFEPANKLIFGVGSLVGTLAPCATRLSIESKNPLTGGSASSNCGSHFAPELKFAGYDHVVLEGRSRKPVYLWIEDEHVELRDASRIWGRTTSETDDMIKEDVGNEDVQVACIGPAGENLVRASCVIVDRARAAGRCGLGAVMGSKNLKALAVKGSGAIEVARPERFMELVDSCREKIRKSRFTKTIGTYGTHQLTEALCELSVMPVRNFQDDYWEPEKIKKLDAEIYRKNYEEATLACFACPIHCSHYYRIKEGPYAGLACEGFEGNDVWDFGCRFDITYASAILKAHELCSQLGLDIDNASCVIAWAFECYEKGILSKNDTDGYELSWGDHKALMEMLRKLAHREGLGDVLAEGCKRAADIIGRGSEKYCLHMKGQDVKEPMRTPKGWALGVAVAARGGGHTTGSIQTELMRVPAEVCEEIWGEPMAGNLTFYQGKAKVVFYMERLTAALDSLGICFFTSVRNDPVDLLCPDDYAGLFSAATGMELKGNDLMMIGERIRNLERVFNLFHASFSRKDDYPPKRFMQEPVKRGPIQGELIEKSKWDGMLDEFYELHRWNPRTGLPTEECLRDLGMERVANDLRRFREQALRNRERLP